MAFQVSSHSRSQSICLHNVCLDDDLFFEDEDHEEDDLQKLYNGLFEESLKIREAN